jgi:hypothetical protein
VRLRRAEAPSDAIGFSARKERFASLPPHRDIAVFRRDSFRCERPVQHCVAVVLRFLLPTPRTRMELGEPSRPLLRLTSSVACRCFVEASTTRRHSPRIPERMLALTAGATRQARTASLTTPG